MRRNDKALFYLSLAFHCISIWMLDCYEHSCVVLITCSCPYQARLKFIDSSATWDFLVSVIEDRSLWDTYY